MDLLTLRVALRFAARPIALDKAAIRKLADDLARRIAAYAAKHDPTTLLGSSPHILDWSWMAKAVKGPDLEVFGYVFSAPSKSPNLVPAAQSTQDFADVTVRIALNGRFPFSDFMDADHSGANGLRYQLYDVLVHEMTHVAEWWFLHQKKEEQHPVHHPELEGEARSEQLRAYYNSSHEVRAYMQQIVEEIMPKAAGFRRRVPAKNNHDFVMKLLNTSTRWKQVSPFLKHENEKLILKAVYDALVHGGVLT